MAHQALAAGLHAGLPARQAPGTGHARRSGPVAQQCVLAVTDRQAVRNVAVHAGPALAEQPSLAHEELEEALQLEGTDPERDAPFEASSGAEEASEPSTSGAEPASAPSGVNQEYRYQPERRFQPQGEQQGGFRQRNPVQDDRPPVRLAVDFPHKVGDTVCGTVCWAGDRGVRVELDSDPSIKGFVPMSHVPYVLRGRQERPEVMRIPLGLRREYVILNLPEGGVEHYGKGPILSAKEPDRELTWRRAEQLRELCDREQEWIHVHIEAANRGGLTAFYEGVVIFIPFSRIPKQPEDQGLILSQEDLADRWVGKTVAVTVETVEPWNNKVIGSIKTAARFKYSRNFQVGNVVWGTVARIMHFGVFVKPEGGDADGLVHISNISRSHVDDCESVFTEGERVKVLITGMEDNGRRISLSTAALEVTPGDMLTNRENVWETAEVMAQQFMQERAANPPREYQPREDRPYGARRQGGQGGNGGGYGQRDNSSFGQRDNSSFGQRDNSGSGNRGRSYDNAGSRGQRGSSFGSSGGNDSSRNTDIDTFDDIW